MIPLRERVKAQHSWFLSGQTRSLRARRQALATLDRFLQAYREPLSASIHVVLGRSEDETWQTELAPVHAEITRCRRRLAAWMRPRRRLVWHHGRLCRYESTREPQGVVAIFGNAAWPLRYTLLPAVDALAAGNCVILKPAPGQQAFSEILSAVIAEAFPASYVTVVDGDNQLAERLAAEAVSHIVMTGNPVSAARIMRTASRRLTPLTLQLGGKNPVVVCRDADLDLAARSILQAKRINCGQDCLAPDYCLVDEGIMDAFLDRLSWHLRYSTAADSLHDPSYQPALDHEQYLRLRELLPSGRIVWGGRSNDQTRQIELTVLDRVDYNSPIMRQEVFGPILPVLGFESLAGQVSRLNLLPHPLMAAVFTKRQEDWKLVSKALMAGQICLNSLPASLPLAPSHGAPGQAGHGQYLGYEGFRRFTYERTLVRDLRFLERPRRGPQAADWYQS